MKYRMKWTAGVACLVSLCVAAGDVQAQRPATDRHMAEVSAYLDRIQIAEPVIYRNLAVYPLLLAQATELRGRWLTLDEGVSQGVLVIREKGEGSVPVVTVENRSRDEHVLIITGEVLSGGKQTRTARRDLIVAPGRRVELDVFCVEARRWEGGKEFSSSRTLVPQSIQSELRKGADQTKIWAEVARNNAALKAENATGSVELALKAASVREKLDEVRRTIVPQTPDGTVGFLFVDRGRAVGAEFFGNESLARASLAKLLDSYVVDYVILRRGPHPEIQETRNDRAAIDLYERICRAGSRRADTPGAGDGIRMRNDGLLGDGVSLNALVHLGVQ